MKSEFRYCFWFNSESEVTQLNLPEINQRIDKVRDFKTLSTREGTRKVAEFPWRFGELSNPPNPERAIAIPAITSSNRLYVPLGFINSDYIASNKLYIVATNEMYYFGILSSRMHMVWMKLTSGRLETRYSYSRDLTFNTFVWPEVSDEQRDEIDKLAKRIRI